MQFIIGGIQKTSLLDYPDKISTIIFTQGCNFNCHYCHNPDLLVFKSKNDIYSTDVIFDFLKKRQGKLDAVVISGGEPALQKDLKQFITKVKDYNFLIKLDTNGSNPQVINDLLNNNLIDYIAMDIKAPLNKYNFVTNVNTDISKIQESIKLIINSNIDYEFRTTVLPSLIKPRDFEDIGILIQNAKKYFLQKFVVQDKINNSEYIYEKNYSDKEFLEIIRILKKYIQNVELR